MLSADNKIISWNKDAEGYYSIDATRIGIYNGKAFPISAYLYDEKELYAFWRMTKLHRNPFDRQSKLNGSAAIASWRKI